MRINSLPISTSSKPAMPAGSVFKLYLSRIRSPGRFLVQNLLVWSLEPEHNMCPNGCHANVQTILSCACSIAPTSLSALYQRHIKFNTICVYTIPFFKSNVLLLKANPIWYYI